MAWEHSHHRNNLYLYELNCPRKCTRHQRIQTAWNKEKSHRHGHIHTIKIIYISIIHTARENTLHIQAFRLNGTYLYGSIHTINITSISMSYNAWAIHRTLEHSEWGADIDLSLCNRNIHTKELTCIAMSHTLYEHAHCHLYVWSMILHGRMFIARQHEYSMVVCKLHEPCNGQCDILFYKNSLAVKYYTCKDGSIILYQHFTWVAYSCCNRKQWLSKCKLHGRMSIAWEPLPCIEPFSHILLHQ